MSTVGESSRVRFHPLAIRPSDDDPETFVVGRPEGGEFVELPETGVEVLKLLDDGMTVSAVAEHLAVDGELPDVADMLRELVDLNWVAALDGERLPDPIGTARVQLGWLRHHHLRWLFSRPARSSTSSCTSRPPAHELRGNCRTADQSRSRRSGRLDHRTQPDQRQPRGMRPAR